jgi:hypothetical protein
VHPNILRVVPGKYLSNQIAIGNVPSKKISETMLWGWGWWKRYKASDW